MRVGSTVLLIFMLTACGTENRPAAKKAVPGNSADAGGDLNSSSAGAPEDESGGSPSGTTFRLPVLRGTAKTSGLRTALSSVNQGAPDSDTLWALALCGCADEAKARLVSQWVQKPGAVPHALVPDMREGVIADPQVQRIIGLPGALVSLLGDLFIDDAELEAQLIDGVQKKLTGIVPGGGDFSTWPTFKFELFPHTGSLAEGASMSIDEQAARWNLLWSLNGMWSGGEPLAFGNHLAQLQQTILTLSEWKYMFGIDLSSVTKTPYGGLAMTKTAGLAGRPQVFDPRNKATSGVDHGFFSGVYTVNYNRGVSKMDLAIREKETWSNITASVNLRSQARQWHAAAMAFGKLKPTARTSTGSLYTSAGGIVGDDAHTLPLAFLPGLSALLDGPFIDKDNRLIYSETKFGNDRGATASLTDLATLSYALGRWFSGLAELDGENLEDAIRQELESGRASIKQALQLTTQNMLLAAAEATDRSSLLEALAALSYVAGNFLQSPFLNDQVARVTNQFFETHMQSVWDGSALTATEVFWLAALLENITVLSPELKSTDTWSDLHDFVQGEIASWSASY